MALFNLGEFLSSFRRRSGVQEVWLQRHPINTHSSPAELRRAWFAEGQLFYMHNIRELAVSVSKIKGGREKLTAAAAVTFRWTGMVQ